MYLRENLSTIKHQDAQYHCILRKWFLVSARDLQPRSPFVPFALLAVPNHEEHHLEHLQERHLQHLVPPLDFDLHHLESEESLYYFHRNYSFHQLVPVVGENHHYFAVVLGCCCLHSLLGVKGSPAKKEIWPS